MFEQQTQLKDSKDYCPFKHHSKNYFSANLSSDLTISHSYTRGRHITYLRLNLLISAASSFVAT